MLPVATFIDLGTKPGPPRCPGDHSRMKKCVQNALWKRARRPIEPLSAQIASKTAKMVPNGAKRALKMCQNHIQKDNHIVSKIMIACSTIALILQTHFTVSFRKATR